MAPWKQKANDIIAELCLRAYREANYRNGRKLKRHVPYSVPGFAAELLECVKTDDELRAKALFMLSHDIPELLND